LPTGEVDVQRTTELVHLAKPMSVTFHRAIDMTKDIFRALDDIMKIEGIQRVKVDLILLIVV
jgi:copper homeostasis protein